MPAARLARLLLLASLAASLAACTIVGSVTGPRSWAISTLGSDGTQTDISINDTTGKVQAVEVDPPDAVAGGGVVVVPGIANALDVPWVGGSCDKQTDIHVAPAGAGLVVDVKVTPDATKPCDAMGVLHTLRLTLNAPIASALVTVRQ